MRRRGHSPASSEIPVRFVDRGVIANRLQIRLATFNIPSRRELEKALKHCVHIVRPEGQCRILYTLPFAQNYPKGGMIPT